MSPRGLKRVNCGGLLLQLFVEPAVCNPDFAKPFHMRGLFYGYEQSTESRATT